jgi:transposase
LADDRSRLVAFTLTPGNVAEIVMTAPLLKAVIPFKRLITDKAYDALLRCDWQKVHCLKAVIPSTAKRFKPLLIDRRVYKPCNTTERLFCHLKNWSRITIHYGRLVRNYMANLALVFAVIAWT